MSSVLKSLSRSQMQLISEREGIPSPTFDEKSRDKGEKKPYFTPELLAEYLAAENICIRFNEITHALQISGFDDENPEQLASNITPLIYSRIQGQYTNVTPKSVSDYIQIIASRNAFNPVLELLSGYHWDKKDRLQAVYSILNIPDDDAFSKVLIKKWLMQCISILHNDSVAPFGCDGVLVFVGSQGIGKTSFFRKLSLRTDFFKEGSYLDFHNKDTLLKALSGWIVELGEIESTVKKDVEKLRAFITQNVDEYRLPYGRAAITSLRRTSFCGTCNSDEFLIDVTGNRRYWTIPISSVNIEDLEELDVLQLWLQVSELVKTEGLQAFRLNAGEQAALRERNCSHEKKLKAQQECEDIISMTNTEHFVVKWIYLTVTEFKQEFREELKSYSSETIGKALDKLGIKAERKYIDGQQKRVRLLPKRVYRCDMRS